MQKQTSSSYFDRAHRLGRIGTVIAIAFMLGIPLVLCGYYNVWPTFGQVASNASGLLAVYLPTALSEVISYTPMLGTACYITFITGNVGNLKVPCALNAMEMTDSPLGTERGDAVSAISIAVSSMVTMAVVAVGVLLLVPLQPILQNPVVKVATNYMLPALFGSMIIINLANNKSGEFTIKNRYLTLLVPMVLIMLFNYFVMPIKGKEGYTMIITIPLTIALAYIMYKMGLVKVVKDEPKVAKAAPIATPIVAAEQAPAEALEAPVQPAETSVPVEESTEPATEQETTKEE